MVMNAIAKRVTAAMVVPLENSKNIAAILQNTPDGGCVGNDKRAVKRAPHRKNIKTLMREDHHRWRAAQFIRKPAQLRRRNKRLLPREISAVVSNAVGSKVCIKNHKLHATGSKRIKCLPCGGTSVARVRKKVFL